MSKTQLIELADIAAFQQAGNSVLCDCRSGPNPRDGYRAGHLPGAIFVDIEVDLSSPSSDPAVGGRHPLPAPHQFAATLQRLGITPTTRVIIYDNSQGANAAARLWWMLRAFGHRHVMLTNGDINTAVAVGMELESGENEPTLAVEPYPVGSWENHIVTLPEVQQISQQRSDLKNQPIPHPETGSTSTPGGTSAADQFDAASPVIPRLLIDVRERDRFRGECEPIDLIAGHIPGACNIPWRENIDAENHGKFRTVAQLRALYQDRLAGYRPDQVVLQCGSGVSACLTLFVLDLIKIKMEDFEMRNGEEGNAKLYVGSWSEWSRNALPIGKEA